MIRVDANTILRSFEEADIPSIAKSANNKKIFDNLRDLFPHPYTKENAKEFVNLTEAEEPGLYMGIVCQNCVGSIGIKKGEDIHRLTAELGYWLSEDYWGKGIMSKAVLAYTDFVFAHFDLQRVFALPFEDNVASQRVLEKCGFVLEGVLMRNAIKNNKIKNMKLYAKTR